MEMDGIFSGKSTFVSGSDLSPLKRNGEVQHVSPSGKSFTTTSPHQIDVTAQAYMLEKNNQCYIIRPPAPTKSYVTLNEKLKYQNSSQNPRNIIPLLLSSATLNKFSKMHNSNVSSHMPNFLSPISSSINDEHASDKPSQTATTYLQPELSGPLSSSDLHHQSEKVKPALKCEDAETTTETESQPSNIKQSLDIPSQNHAVGTHSHTSFGSRKRDYSRDYHSSRHKEENISQQYYFKRLESKHSRSYQTHRDRHKERNEKYEGRSSHPSHSYSKRDRVHKTYDRERKERREDKRDASKLRESIENTNLRPELESNTIENIKEDKDTCTESEKEDSARTVESFTKDSTESEKEDSARTVESFTKDSTESPEVKSHESKSQESRAKKISFDQYRARKNGITPQTSTEITGDNGVTRVSEETLKISSPVSSNMGDSEDLSSKKESDETPTMDSNDEKIKLMAETNAEERKPLEDKEELKEGFNLNRSILNKMDFYGKPKTGSGISSPFEKKSAVEDPVILTISSDEEDNSESGKENREGNTERPISDSVLVGGGSEEKMINPRLGKSYDDEDLFTERELKDDHVKLRCKKVWIGSYHVRPKNGVILVRKGCFTFFVPKVTSGRKGGFEQKYTKLILKDKGIVEVAVHLDGEDPMIFLYLGRRITDYIQRELNMIPGRPYLDPHSKDECEKRIAIFFEPLNPEIRHSVQEFWTDVERSSGKLVCFTEITAEKATDLLLKIKPSTQDRKQYSSEPRGTETLFVYPPPPHKGGITITTDDYRCLAEEQFLNDVIIDFYIGWILAKKMGTVDPERIHAFSTFFYKCLTSKPKSRPSVKDAMTPAQRRHARVQSWTKNVNIFEKDFVLVPINERSHWFLAIICFPYLNGPAKMSNRTPVKLKKVEIEKSQKKAKSSVESPYIDDSEGSERDEAEGDDEDLEEEEGDLPVKKQKIENEDTTDLMQVEQLGDKGKEEESIIQPCILIFDSMAGSASSKKRVVATLREYLSEEYRTKMNGVKEISRETMKGACPKVPQQSNFTDCGLYTLQFAQSFFEQPLKDFRFPIGTLSNWFNQDVVACKRKHIAGIITELLDKQKPNHGITLPTLNFKYGEDRTRQHNESTDEMPEFEKFKSASSRRTEKPYQEESSGQCRSVSSGQCRSVSSGQCRSVSSGQCRSVSSGQCRSVNSGQCRRVSFEPRDIAVPKAKKLRVTICDKSRPKTPSPDKLPSPLSMSDDDSGHHSDVGESGDINKSFYRSSNSHSQPSTSSRENFKESRCSAFRPTKGSDYRPKYRSDSPIFKSNYRKPSDKFYKYGSSNDRK